MRNHISYCREPGEDRSVIHTQRSTDGTRIDTICHRRRFESGTKCGTSRFQRPPQPEQSERFYLRVLTIRSSFDNWEKKKEREMYHKNILFFFLCTFYWKYSVLYHCNHLTLFLLIIYIKLYYVFDILYM